MFLAALEVARLALSRTVDVEHVVAGEVDDCLGEGLVRIGSCAFLLDSLNVELVSALVATVAVRLDTLVGVLRGGGSAPQFLFSDCSFTCVHLDKILWLNFVAGEGLEPPTRFCPVPAYETGEMTNFSIPLCCCGEGI